jgi:predicted nucleic acid-binding protein
MSFIQRANIRLAHLSKPIALNALCLRKNSKRISFADTLLCAEVFSSDAKQVYTFDQCFPAGGIVTLT